MWLPNILLLSQSKKLAFLAITVIQAACLSTFCSVPQWLWIREAHSSSNASFFWIRSSLLGILPFCSWKQEMCFVCLIRFFTSQSTIFQLCWNGPSWVEPVLSKDKCVLLKDITQWRLWGFNLRPLGTRNVSQSDKCPQRRRYFKNWDQRSRSQWFKISVRYSATPRGIYPMNLGFLPQMI